MTTIRIATRASRQATTQAGEVAERLRADGHKAELVEVDTYGDRTQATEVPLHTIGGTGVFVKEVQRAVLDGRADIAVHSAKDMPTQATEGLQIRAFLPRRNPADTLVGRSLADLEAGAVVATGSVRRRAQIRRARPDLSFAELRGNIDTRLQKIPRGGSIVVAAAALELLGYTDLIAQELSPIEFVPAVGQGCVAVEARSDDREIITAIDRLDDAATRNSVMIERSFLAQLGTGCSAPVGAYADDQYLWTFLASIDGPRSIRTKTELSGVPETDRATAAELATQGAAELGFGTTS